MMLKKEDHNAGVSDGIKKFFNGRPYQEFLKKYLNKNIKNFKNSALSKNLIKSIKRYFIKNLIKNLKKVPYHV